MGKSVPPVRLLWCKSKGKSRFWPPVRHMSLSLGIFNKMFKRTNGKPTSISHHLNVTFSDRHVFHDFFWFLHARPLLQLWFKYSSFSVLSELCKLKFIFTASHSGNWRAELEDIFDSALYLACSFLQELLAGCLVLWGKLPHLFHLCPIWEAKDDRLSSSMEQ